MVKLFSLTVITVLRENSNLNKIRLSICPHICGGSFYISKPPLIVTGISTTKRFLVFINVLRAEEEMRCFFSISLSTKAPYILKVTTNLIKRYIFFFRLVYNFQFYSAQYYYLRLLRRLSAYFRHS